MELCGDLRDRDALPQVITNTTYDSACVNSISYGEGVCSLFIIVDGSFEPHRGFCVETGIAA